MEHERRQHPRVKFSAEAVVSVDGKEVGTYEIQDLSVGGAYLTGGQGFAAGTRIVLRITSSLLRGAVLEASVIRARPFKNCVGIGVQFMPAASKVDELLQQTIIAELKKANVADFVARS